MYQFCRRMLVGCIMEFILHGRKECARNVIRAVIVDARRKYVRDLLIEVPFAHPYVADTLKEFAEIPATISL